MKNVIDFEFQDYGEFFTVTSASDAGDEWAENKGGLPGHVRDDEEGMLYMDREEALALINELGAAGMQVCIVSDPSLLS